MLSMVVVVVGDRRRRPATKVGWNSWLETFPLTLLLLLPFVPPSSSCTSRVFQVVFPFHVLLYDADACKATVQKIGVLYTRL